MNALHACRYRIVGTADVQDTPPITNIIMFAYF